MTPLLRALCLFIGLGFGLAPGAAQAFTVTLSPRGESPRVQQISARFSADVVALGQADAPAPFEVSCTGGAAPPASARWEDERTWVHDFRDPLGPGVRCRVSLRTGWKPLQGSLEGAREASFSTGGPAVLSTRPFAGAQIEEDQTFVLELNGAAQTQSVLRHAWCQIEGLGDRVPVRIISGTQRDEVIKARRLSARQARVLLLACERALPNEAKVRLVWGKGIAAASQPEVLTSIEQRTNFTVRKRFTAEFHCQRERAAAPCLPMLPFTVQFSAPVPRALAARLVLRPFRGSALKPLFDADDASPEVSSVQFAPVQAENAGFQLEVPPDLADHTGRKLANAAQFPLAVRSGEAPPLAKFANSAFGIIELNAGAMLPLTLRHVQGEVARGAVRVLRVTGDADMARWLARLRELDDTLEARERSAFGAQDAPRKLELPQLDGAAQRPLEVVGVPLPEPGLHVVEIESPRLGAALLAKPAPLYVRTAALVTNLGVHVKRGRENAVVWVTTLDRARPVAGAQVAINDCQGRALWSGSTDAHGLARMSEPLPLRNTGCADDDTLFVSARKTDEQGRADVSFVLSSWQKGIEPWRFNFNTSLASQPDLRSHTVLDRSLVRAGETVAMKHFARIENSAGLSLPQPEDLPTRARIVHSGSGQESFLPLVWQAARQASTRFEVPAGAKLGQYRIELERPARPGREAFSQQSGEFRVEEFRVPLIDARLSAPKLIPIAPRELALPLQLNFMAGGPVAGAPVQASALLRERAIDFAGYEEFQFAAPRLDLGEQSAASEDEANDGARLVADKIAARTDAQGAATLVLKDLPAIKRPSMLQAEANYTDPNGELKTTTARIELWPSEVVLGLRTQGWASTRGARQRVQLLALNTAGTPLVKQKLELRGRHQLRSSARKRLVGGLYAYDETRQVVDLGVLCSGLSDSRGQLECDVDLQRAGQVELVASSADAQGRSAEAAASLWVTRSGELWFAQDNDDRIDLLPEKKHYQPGETARLQVRMPFRQATVLLSVEREGVIATRVLTLRADDPTIELKIDKSWGPNVYVSVLALRGRVRDVPLRSFFAWGWKTPLDWWQAWREEGPLYQPPTAMADLARPAHKFGAAQLKVGLAAHELQVSVTPDKELYGVRDKASVRIKVSHGGQPLPDAQVAFAAVDEGLLALSPNVSWDLLNGLMPARTWGVETSTAHSEIVGRRHFGRKAVPAGGGGGRRPTRELFDTLLLWRPVVTLDARGEAVLEVPLNDSLTRFKLVAVADAGAQQFGTGSASIRVSQDLQLLSGLPPLVRQGDRFSAPFTARNTTAREMKLRVALQGTVNSEPGLMAPSATAGSAASPPRIDRTVLALPAQDITLAAGAARELSWDVAVPGNAFSITWQATVDELQGKAKDQVTFTQRVSPAVPLRVVQASVRALDGAQSSAIVIATTVPADALPGSASLRVSVQAKLATALPGVQRFFETYPYSCLEQKASVALGLADLKRWAALTRELPSYLDADGLASYFPTGNAGVAQGSDRLTAYVLAAAHEAGAEIPAPARDAMLAGLAAFVEGRIERRFWAPRADLDARKLAAIEALARHGKARVAMLDSINLTPTLWPTATLLDWLSLLKRMSGVPQHAKRLAEAQALLRARLSISGTTLKFSNESDDAWWWLMDSADGNAAKLILATLDDAQWKPDMPRLLQGHLARQQGGAWTTTTGNLWGVLALRKFSAAFEAVPVAGITKAALGSGSSNTSTSTSSQLDWAAHPEGGTLPALPLAAGSLQISHEGTGKPWVTVQALAAVPLKAPLRAGYRLSRSVVAVERKVATQWSRGDVLRVRLEVDASADMNWVVLSDPVPAGAVVLGSGLGGESAIASRGEKRSGQAWPAFQERSFEAFRSYYEFLPRGKHVLEYTLRLNSAGRFALPPTRVEAMYAPERHGALPNAAIEVLP